MPVTIDEFFIPYGAAKAFPIDQGNIVRLVQPEGGGQVADVTAFNRDDPSERLWGWKTAWDFGLHLTTGDQLISTGPRQRPLLTIVGDSLASRGPRSDGALWHDVFSCCSRKTLVQRAGAAWDRPGCFELLSGAVAPLGFPPYYIHDTFNPFMLTRIEDDKLRHQPSDAEEGEFVELRAEIPLVLAISACQGRSTKLGAKGVRVEIVSGGATDAEAGSDPTA